MAPTLFLAALLALAMLSAPALAAVGISPPAPKVGVNPTYTNLANFTGQFAITLDKRQSPSDAWSVHVCNATTLGGACNQPVFSLGTTQELRLNWNIRNATAPLRTWKGGVPITVKARINYMPSAQINRGWRKKNQAYPGSGWHVKRTLASIPYVASGSAVWDLAEADQVTKAVLYPEVCVICQFADGTTDYCQCDRRNAGAATLTFETDVKDSISSSMRAAAIALSAFSPLSLVIYWVSDSLFYKRTGKSLRFIN